MSALTGDVILCISFSAPAEINRHGAVPGEGPRSGWFGNEDWGRDKERRTWEIYADTAEKSITRDEWLRAYRPN